MADKENSAILKGGAVTFKPKKLSYAYDANGNIETIRKNGVLQETYHYDVLNQLVRADSAAQGKSFVYTYDAGGNILSVKEYAYTTGALGTAVKTVNYGYTDGTWKDLLTSYAGQTITYDGIGNPLSYRDGLSMTWRNGRELASLTKNGVTASYLYDESGLRTKKTVGGVVTNYHVINGVLYGEYTGSHRLLYMFDEAGTRYSFLYNGSTYYYVFNGQGDVIGITDGTGNMLARYTYDAWGKPLTITDGAGNDVSGNASHIANVNPFRYRGYYYDKESGLYYLQSRYYDPVVGRFINADDSDVLFEDQDNLVEHNLFTYCLNNPVNMIDEDGRFAITLSVIAVGALITAASAAAIWAVNTPSFQRAWGSACSWFMGLRGAGRGLFKTAKAKKPAKKKTAKKSGKEKASNAPDWAKRQKYDKNKSADSEAGRVLDEKYGKGKWRKGADSEFSKIKKWLQRDKGFK